MEETQDTMVGQTGVGKSGVGNSLLEKESEEEKKQENKETEDWKTEKEPTKESEEEKKQENKETEDDKVMEKKSIKAVWNTAFGEMRVVMVGKTGVGKSSVGNSLLKKEHFKSNALAGSVTSKCKFGSRKLEDGTNLVVVDTPGIFDTSKSNKDTSNEVVRCIGLSSPGPHAFFFVLKIGSRYTAEERDTIQSLKDIFGTEVMRYVIVVFTGKDSLKREQITLDEYISKTPPELKKLITECNGRFVAINNWAEPDERERDIQEIFQLIRKTTENGGKHYTGEMYEAAEEAFKEKLRLLEEEKNKREQELDQKEKKLEEESLNMKKKLEEEMAAKRAAIEEEQRQRELEFEKREEELAQKTERLNNLRLEEEKRPEEKMNKLLAEQEEEIRKIQGERKQEAKEREEERRRYEKEREELRRSQEERERQLKKERKESEEKVQKLEEEQKKRIKEIEEKTEAERKKLQEEREKLEENERDRLRQKVQDDDNFYVKGIKKVWRFIKGVWKAFDSRS